MINKLVNSRLFKQYIIKDYNVLGVYVGGSRQTKLNNEDSDYDLVVIYDEPFTIPLESFLNIKYKNINIHWYYVNIREFINIKDVAISTTGKLATFTLDTTFIYKGIDLSFLKKYKDEYSRIAVYKLYKSKLHKFINNLFNRPQLEYTKILYYGEVLYYLISNLDLDIDYIKEVKSGIKNNNLSNECLIKINEHLKYVESYFNKLKDFDLKYEVDKLNNLIYKEYEKIL